MSYSLWHNSTEKGITVIKAHLNPPVFSEEKLIFALYVRNTSDEPSESLVLSDTVLSPQNKKCRAVYIDGSALLYKSGIAYPLKAVQTEGKLTFESISIPHGEAVLIFYSVYC